MSGQKVEYKLSQVNIRNNRFFECFYLTSRIRSLSWAAVVFILLSILATSSSGSASFWSLFKVSTAIESSRHPSSVFPQTGNKEGTSEILNNYSVYLSYVLEVARATNSRQAAKLESTYKVLKSRYPAAAAGFLKGLRYEMMSKLELMGASPSSLSSSNPEMRRWVSRFMREWIREADEHLFRAVAAAKIGNNEWQ